VVKENLVEIRVLIIPNHAPATNFPKKPKSDFMKLTSQILSLTSLTPTFCPANTKLRLILRRPMQMQPQVVTVMVR
jgi:hypothetical protein